MEFRISSLEFGIIASDFEFRASDFFRQNLRGFPLILRSLQETGDIRLVPVKNQGRNDDAENEIGLRVTSEKGDQNRDRRCAGDRSE